MPKPYLQYDVPKRSLKDRVFSQRPSALIIEGLLVLVAVVVTIGFLTPAAPVVDNSGAIAELEAVIAAQEAALAEAAEAVAQAAEAAAIPRGFLSASAAKDMAWSSLSSEEYRSAIALYDVLIAEGEADVHTIFARGYAFSMIDEHAKAAQDYTTVLQESPTDVSALNNRCWAFSEIGQFDRALADCNDLIIFSEDEAAYPYLNRGIVYEMRGEMDKALADYVEYMKRNQSRVVRNENLAWEGSLEVPMEEGLVYVFPFKASAGQDVVVSATSIQRDLDADPLVLILDPQGEALIANDDTGEWWDSLVEFRAPVSGEYAVVMTHAGGSTEGKVEVSFDIAGQFTMGNDGARFKSDAYRALMSGDYSAALENFRRALSINHQDAEAMNWLGVTYRYMGEYETSITHISMAMRLDESYSLPYLSRGITFENMGDSAASAADYFQYAMRNRSRTLFHAELEGDSNFQLPMRDGWVYSIPFDGKRGQELDISVATGEPGFVDPLIILIGPDGKPLIGDDDISFSEYDSTISDFHLPKSGQYTLVVSHAEGGSNGMINVDVEVAQPAAMSIPRYSGCSGGH